jgi:hypothetical protein
VERKMLNDDLILWIAKQLEQYGDTHIILDQDNVDKMDFAFNVLRWLVKGDNLAISKEINDDLYRHGVIRMNGKNITIENPRLFGKVVRLASCFDVCPKLDGSIDLDFTFNDLIAN